MHISRIGSRYVRRSLVHYLYSTYTLPNITPIHNVIFTELGTSHTTICKIAKELKYLHTKPWHTDVLTPAQKYKRLLFCQRLMRMTDEALFHWLCTISWTDEKWWDIVGRNLGRWVKADSKLQAKMGNQCPRNHQKKGGVHKRVYCWGCISVHGKSKLVVWTAKSAKNVIHRHTKKICVGTLFEEDGVVWRVVETKSMKDGEEVVSYCNHFENPDEDLPIDECEFSRYSEVRQWHQESHERLAGLFVLFVCMRFIIIRISISNKYTHVCVSRGSGRIDLQTPNGMQDTNKTVEIYRQVVCVSASQPYPSHTAILRHVAVQLPTLGRHCIRFCPSTVSMRSWRTTRPVITTMRFGQNISRRK